MTQGHLEAATRLLQGNVETEALDMDRNMASQLFNHSAPCADWIKDISLKVWLASERGDLEKVRHPDSCFRYHDD